MLNRRSIMSYRGQSMVGSICVIKVARTSLWVHTVSARTRDVVGITARTLTLITPKHAASMYAKF